MIKILLTLFSLLALTNAYADEADVHVGKTLYHVYCTQCHGVEGDGWGINAADMEVLPKDHTDTESMGTRTDEGLFKAIKFGGKSIDKSILMPNWDGNFTDDQIHELVKYLRYICCTKTE